MSGQKVKKLLSYHEARQNVGRIHAPMAVKLLIIPIICSTWKLNRPIPPNTLCMVHHSLFTFRLIPRKERQWKFSVRRSCCASVSGMAGVAIPYQIPARSLNLYAIQPMRAGKCALYIQLIQLLVFPVTFSSIYLELLQSIVDHTPRDFSTVTWAHRG